MDEQTLIRETRGWSDEQRRSFLDELRLKAARVRYPTPAAMAADLLPGYNVTPAVDLISEVVREAVLTPNGRYIVTTPPRTGKLMSMETPIPTPDGWTDHGSIQVGDTVFHPDGTPIKVLAVHTPATADRRVFFSDGSHADVHHLHEWTVWDRSRGGARSKICSQCGRQFTAWVNTGKYCNRACGTRARWGHSPTSDGASLSPLDTASSWRTVETDYLMSVKLFEGTPGVRGHRFRFQLPFTESLKCEPSDLPVDPYTLGVWLGDGSASKAALTHSEEDEYAIPYPRTARCVHATTGVLTDYYGGGLLHSLTNLGVRGNKHIPLQYLRASEDQRRALLAGLIDSDGHSSGRDSIRFHNTNRALIDGVYDLTRGLGYQAGIAITTRPGDVGGISSDGNPIVATRTCWSVSFTPHDGRTIARLPRKAHARDAQRRRIAITRVERIEPVPGRCITVDSADGLYLAGKTMIPTHNSELVSVIGPAWANVYRPGIEVMLASYSDTLATEHSRKSRRLITDHGDRLGVRLSDDKTAVGHWTTNHGTGRGGMLAGGILSGMTGFGAGLLIVDDIFKNHQEADSVTLRTRILNEFRETLMTRLYPGASVIIVMTRWHPEDLAGVLLTGDEWTYINIPALSEAGIPDALGREPGVYLDSALGFTPADFQARRRQIGERAWYALYQGAPNPPEGGLFNRSWFNDHRLTVQPERSTLRLVAVDPAETGDRDEAGVVAAALLPDGTIALTHDRSSQMTSDQWAHAAVKLAMETQASEIAVETYTAGTTYVNVVKRAITAYRDALREDYDGNDIETGAAIRRSYELTVYPWRRPGDAVARSASLRQAIEVGTCRVVSDELAEMESQAVLWQVGQHQPDRVAASLIAHNRLLELAGRKTTFGSPMRSANRPQGENSQRVAWLSRKVG